MPEIVTQNTKGTPLTYLEGDKQIAWPVTPITGNTTLDSTHNREILICDGGHTLTLETAATVEAALDATSEEKVGLIFTIINNSAGIVTIAANSNNINGSVANIYLNQYESITVTYDITSNGYFTTQRSTSSYNHIINGSMDIWQRGTSFANPASGSYLCDRFSRAKVNAAAVTYSQETSVLPTIAEAGAKFSYSLKATIPSTADTSIAATDYEAIFYKAEGYDYAKLAGKTVTLSFWVRSSNASPSTYCVAAGNSNSTYSYVREYTIDVADTWEKKTLTFPLTESTSGWDYAAGVGLELSFTLAAGGNFQGTKDQWNNADDIATSSQVNWLNDVGATFYLAGVMLSTDGSTKFTSGTYQEELAKCQRYYEKSYNTGTAPGTADAIGCAIERIDAVASGVSVSDMYGMRTNFSVKKRDTPTVTWYSVDSGSSGLVYNATTGPADIAIVSTIYRGTGSTGIPSLASTQDSNDIILGHWTADAEL